jgi:hypothetical protein
MVVVMYGGVLFAVCVAVVLAAIKDARLVKESLSEIKPVSSLPILITSQIVRPDKERVLNNV